MSIVVGRQAVCDNLVFSRDSERADLMDSALTNSALIAFLGQLLSARDGVWRGKLLVTAVRSDHPTYDGPNGHSGGNAIDFTQTADPDNAVVHLVRDVQACSYARGIGLGGPFQAAADECGGYNAQSKLFEDNDTDHIHVQVVGY